MCQMRVLLCGAAVLSGVDPRSLIERDRRRPLVEARAAVAVAAYGLPGMTLDAIGAGLGGRQRSGVRKLIARHAQAVAHRAAALRVLAESLEVRA